MDVNSHKHIVTYIQPWNTHTPLYTKSTLMLPDYLHHIPKLATKATKTCMFSTQKTCMYK